ncbi:MAG: FKBP-type peptidyl-prolyl cis-trans isomerase [Fibrobacter sp.]|jgi:FKBP-type peptidyl-prolyl cis-trans isomerase|nr:FKBP-type peptidyl-prolyl cis-trans isomerase [Fibrobacter sp.]
MNRFFLLAGVCAFALFASSCEKSGKQPNVSNDPITTFEDSVSYIIGFNMGGSLREIKDEVNLNLLMQGISDIINGNETKITREMANSIMRRFDEQMREKVKKAEDEKCAKNKAEGSKFLEENKSKDGVITTASGLQYIVLKEGSGPKPKETDQVKVNYFGTLIDGTEFDNSYKRGQPAEFRVSGVIKGWTEALQLMNTGSKFKIFVPSELAYGDRSAGPQIGPGSVLIFEIELLEIVNTDKK